MSLFGNLWVPISAVLLQQRLQYGDCPTRNLDSTVECSAAPGLQMCWQ
jgi:hypothetical protein